MDNQNPQPEHNKLTQTLNQLSALSPAQIAIGRSVSHINQLTAFPLTVEQISDWVISISELRPEATPEQIKEVIDGMKVGALDYDPRLGIQNIFRGLDFMDPSKNNPLSHIPGN